MHQMRISTNPREKNVKTERAVGWKPYKSAMKLSQIRRRIELCQREIILRFEMNLQNLLFSWQFNSYSYFKASTEVLTNWMSVWLLFCQLSPYYKTFVW
jgi:hypothetical protein